MGGNILKVKILKLGDYMQGDDDIKIYHTENKPDTRRFLRENECELVNSSRVRVSHCINERTFSQSGVIHWTLNGKPRITPFKEVVKKGDCYYLYAPHKDPKEDIFDRYFPIAIVPVEMEDALNEVCIKL